MAVASVICAAIALVLPLTALRLLFAIPLALALPGYSIASASFARRGISWPQVLMLTLGLSVATLALGALMLNYAPGGIRPLSWAVFLLVVVLGACGVAAHRRQGSPPADGLALPRPHISPVEAVLVLGAALSVAAALVLAFTTFAARNALGYTSLWILPGTPMAPAIRVGVRSDEQEIANYVLQVRRQAGHREILRAFSLKPGETQGFSFPVPPSNGPQRVTASLYRAELPHKLYRRVYDWVPPTQPR